MVDGFYGATTSTSLPFTDNSDFDRNAEAHEPSAVLIVDSTVEDAAVLLDGLDPHIHVVRTEDGKLDDAIQSLEALSPAGAVHILTHGEPGAFNLAGERIDAAYIESHTSIANALAHVAASASSVALWACNVAKDSVGQSFVKALTSLTGANVYAAQAPVGAAAQGGSWFIGTQAPFSRQALEAYPHTLPTFDFTGGTLGTASGADSIADNEFQETESGVTMTVAFDDGSATADDDATLPNLTVQDLSGDYLRSSGGINVTTVTVSFDSAIQVDSFVIGVQSGTVPGTYTFTPVGTGSAFTMTAPDDFTNSATTVVTPADWTSVTSFTVTSSNGQWDAVVDTVTFTLPANNAPTVSGAPTDITVTEDTASSVDLSAVTFADADSGDTLTVTLKVDSGTFSTPADGSGEGAGVDETLVNSTTITLVGDPDDINSYLDTASNIQYTGASNASGGDAATLTIAATDGTDSAANNDVNIDITAVNDDPTISGLAADVTVTEDTASNLDLSASAIADVDSTGTITTYLIASAGTLAATSGGSVTVSGSGSGTLTLSGTIANINTFLDTASNVTYTGASNANGNDAATLTVRANDGDGSGNVDLGTVNLDITAVNDDPEISGLASDVTVTEDTASNLDLSASAFSDVDSSGTVTVYLIAGAGTMTATSGGSVTVGGSGTGTLSLSGTFTNINSFLDTASNVQYTGASDASGNDATTLTVRANDGDGSGNVDLGTVNVDITAVNDDPTLSGLPADVTVTEDTASSVDLSAANFGDVDSSSITVTLTASAGTFSTPASGAGAGAGVTATLVNSTTITLAGAPDDIDTYLDTASNIQYTGASNTSGNDAATITVTANDGDGSGDVSLGTVNLDITAVNDDPTISGLATDVTVTEDAASDLDLSASAFADVDSAGTVTVYLIAGAGTMTATSGGSVTVGGSGTGTLSLSGTFTNINSFLDTASNVQYTGASDASGNDATTITVRANDGDGSGNVDLGTVNVDITAVNDAPVLDSGQSPTLTAIDEDAGDDDGSGADGDDDATNDANNGGTTVATMVVDSSITDADGSAVESIAVTTVDNTNGVWQYSTDSGTSWNNFSGTTGTSVDIETSARLLDSADMIRFVPDADYNGSATITFRAWDETSGTAGGTANASSNGGSTAFSSASDTASITVNAVNDAPTFAGLDGAPSFTEGGSVVTFDSDVTISDLELDAADDFSGASLTIARNGGADSNDDFDFDTSGASFTLSGGNLQSGGQTFATFTDSSGTLTINFTSGSTAATGALVDDVLQRITYQNTSDDPASSAQMDWTFSDGTDSDSGSTTVSITGVNDEPTLTATGQDPTFTEGGSNQDLFSGVTIDTVESGQTITGMTITVTDVSDTGEEFMEIDGSSIDITQADSGTTTTNSLSYSVAFSSGTATITLSGSLSEVAAQTLVDGLTYGHTGDDPTTGSSRVVALTSITDSGSNTGDNDNVAALAVSSTVSITAVNDAPVVSNLNGDNASEIVAGDGAQDVTDLNDVTVTNADSSDYNGGFITLSQSSGTTNGDWSVDGTNVTSGGDATISAGETIQVGGVSIGTVDATDDGQGGTLTINFSSANATNANVQTLIQNLELSAATGLGDRSFTLVLNDGDGTANSGDEDTAATFTVGVTGNPPAIGNLDGDSLTFTEGDSATLIDVSSNATLTDADSSNFDGGNMTVTFQSGGQAAEDLLTLDTSGTVSLAGTTAGSNVSVSGTVVGTLGNNISAGNDLVINFNTDATPARVQELLQAVQYNNVGGDNPTDGDRVVRVTITDAASNAATGTADITVNVDPVNDAASGASLPTDVTVTEDTASDVDLSAADFTDPDSASVTVTLTIDDGTFSTPADGAGVGVDETLVSSTEITLAGNADDIDTYLDTASNIQYTGSSNTNGGDAATITVTVNDGDGSGDVAVGTVNIDITAVNDDPTVASLPTDVTVTEDTASNVDLSAANFGDVDSATITVTLTLDDGTFSSPADGAGVGSGVTETLVSSTVITLVGDADDIDTYLDTASNIQYTGSADTNGDNAATITVTANDGDGSGDVAMGTVNIDITAVNDDPTGASLPTDVTVTEDTASDVDLSAADFGDVDSASITVTLTLSDGTFGTPADGAGVGVTATLANSTTITLAGDADDIDTYLDTASNIQYTSAANADTDDAATITVTANDGDGSGDVAIATVNVDVTGVNDLPTSSGGSISTAEDSNKTFASSNFNFSDVDTGDTLQSVRIDTLPSTGTLKLSGVNVTAGDVIAVGDIGNLTFNPPSNQSGSTSFTYSVNDGTGFATSTATMNISISARNDAPTNVSLSNSSVQEVVPGAVVGTVSASDVDDSSLTYTVSDNRFTIDSNNQLKLKAGQILDFETEPTVTVTLTATDDDGASDSDDFTITVIDVNEIINGGSNDDTIDGTDNDDYVQSGSGNNRIRTGGGKDTIDGGDGNDDIGGGNDDDFLKGGGGNDTVDGGLGNDLVYAGLGDLGDDTVLGSGGFDSLGGGAGNDKLDGGDNDDLLWGRFGDDTVDGGTGDDMLYNGEGSDTVMGGTGDDTLWAGAGDDVLSGGSGEDVFIFGTASGNDTISDFELANDTLDLQYSGAGFDALADVQAAASDVTQNGEAGLLIDLGNGQSVFLIGLDTGDLASMTVTL
ncbi:DUF4347 domain-containing protein [Kordiimonas lacus]|uniref:Cadherin domain-containing protein n=1 Tax=Kordiimonas lacus TaxID=637679 RepID=A0A1G6T0V7_9PROT|nr:DUF4347 domain-containing protein [Kordiimonas lacus]SDD22156.1 protein of unknown function [Kordiimonas lacus]